MSFMLIDASKTLGAGDDGVIQIVTADVTLTIPEDATHNFAIGDRIEMYNDSGSVITLAKELGVNVRAVGMNVALCGRVVFKKIAANDWIGWGDLS